MAEKSCLNVGLQLAERRPLEWLSFEILRGIEPFGRLTIHNGLEPYDYKSN